MIAILDAFVFLTIIAGICIALPSLEPKESQVSLDPSLVVRGAHEALLRGNSSGLPGGDGLAFWTYAELAFACREGEKIDAMASKAFERLAMLLPTGAWEWSVGGSQIASIGNLTGDIFCDEIASSSGACFRLRFAPSAAGS
jgi:hypothetical protein